MNKVYYRVHIKMLSPLSIGGYDNFKTDCDIVLDSKNQPCIPATTLAGLFRNSFKNDIEKKHWFGDKNDDEKIDKSSRILFYDGLWHSGNKIISVRNNVQLKNKIAKDGSKFDRQIVERGAEFVFYIEINVEKNDEDKLEHINSKIEDIIADLHNGDILIGAKTTRGFGRAILVKEDCKRKVFKHIEDEENDSQDGWLNFEMFDNKHWEEDYDCYFLEKEARDFVIDIKLKQKGAISIREYSTEPNKPDYTQLYVRDNNVCYCKNISAEERFKPVIPGTSWTGAFRDRFLQFSFDKVCNKWFGYTQKTVNEKGEDITNSHKSKIRFSETELKNGVWKEITRNSIDRFTGGTLDGELFTEGTYYYGEGNLEIRIRDFDKKTNIDTLKILFAVIADLNYGFMNIGGLGAVGHGLFEVESIVICDNEYKFPKLNEILEKDIVNDFINIIDEQQETTSEK